MEVIIHLRHGFTAYKALFHVVVWFFITTLKDRHYLFLTNEETEVKRAKGQAMATPGSEAKLGLDLRPFSTTACCCTGPNQYSPTHQGCVTWVASELLLLRKKTLLTVICSKAHLYFLPWTLRHLRTLWRTALWSISNSQNTIYKISWQWLKDTILKQLHSVEITW